MTSDERIIDIARYLGEHELTCKKCGLIMDVSEGVIDMKAGKRGNPIFSASCPDCGAYIKRMRNSKGEKIFWRGSTHEVAKLETSLLIWMLQVGYITNERVIAMADELLKTHRRDELIEMAVKYGVTAFLPEEAKEAFIF